MPHSKLGIKRKWAEHVANARSRNARWAKRADEWRNKKLSVKQREAFKSFKASQNSLSTDTATTLSATPIKDTSGSGRSSLAGLYAGSYGQTRSNLFRRLKRKLRDIRRKQHYKLTADNSLPDNTDDDILDAADRRTK